MPRRKHTDITTYTIYKIACLDPKITDVYVGSTIDLKQRKMKHKYDCKKKNCIVNVFIRENGGWENWKVYVIEEIECNKYQAELREEYWRKELNATLNGRMCVFNKAIGEYRKYWYENNKDKIKKKHRDNYHANLDEERERSCLYYQKHKDELAEKRKEITECPICKRSVRKADLSTHQKRNICVSISK